MELQAGRPQAKGNNRGPAHAYNVKELRNQEMRVAEQAQKSYEHFVEAWRPRRSKEKAVQPMAPRFATRRPRGTIIG
jgi:transposase